MEELFVSAFCFKIFPAVNVAQTKTSSVWFFIILYQKHIKTLYTWCPIKNEFSKIPWINFRISRSVPTSWNLNLSLNSAKSQADQVDASESSCPQRWSKTRRTLMSHEFIRGHEELPGGLLRPALVKHCFGQAWRFRPSVWKFWIKARIRNNRVLKMLVPWRLRNLGSLWQ